MVNLRFFSGKFLFLWLELRQHPINAIMSPLRTGSGLRTFYSHNLSHARHFKSLDFDFLSLNPWSSTSHADRTSAEFSPSMALYLQTRVHLVAQADFEDEKAPFQVQSHLKTLNHIPATSTLSPWPRLGRTRVFVASSVSSAVLVPGWSGYSSAPWFWYPRAYKGSVTRPGPTAWRAHQKFDGRGKFGARWGPENEKLPIEFHSSQHRKRQLHANLRFAAVLS